MPESIFILFAIFFIAVQFIERRLLRISFAVITLIALMAGVIALRYSHYYGRTYITLAVDHLAKKSPPEQRERLVTASNRFRQTYSEESPFAIAASAELWSAIKQADYSDTESGESDADTSFREAPSEIAE